MNQCFCVANLWWNYHYYEDAKNIQALLNDRHFLFMMLMSWLNGLSTASCKYFHLLWQFNKLLIQLPFSSWVFAWNMAHADIHSDMLANVLIHDTLCTRLFFVLFPVEIAFVHYITLSFIVLVCDVCFFCAPIFSYNSHSNVCSPFSLS